jgi:hypothetical protein
LCDAATRCAVARIVSNFNDIAGFSGSFLKQIKSGFSPTHLFRQFAGAVTAVRTTEQKRSP